MKNIEEYYKKTENALPHKNIQEFISKKLKIGQAIDLGCGTGRDTIYLIKNNWSVLAIDRENTKDIIVKQLNNEEKTRFTFKQEKFENIELIKNDLVVANFSIPFCNKNYFKQLWNEVNNSILVERLFCWELSWKK